jgi:hypothetical protein
MDNMKVAIKLKAISRLATLETSVAGDRFEEVVFRDRNLAQPKPWAVSPDEGSMSLPPNGSSLKKGIRSTTETSWPPSAKA